MRQFCVALHVSASYIIRIRMLPIYTPNAYAKISAESTRHLDAMLSSMRAPTRQRDQLEY